MAISNISSRLESSCNLLDSAKITSRKQGCEDLRELLDEKDTIAFLNESGPSRWNRVLGSIQSCMVKEIDKKNEDYRKKGTPSALRAPPVADVFATFVRAAIKENAPLNFKKLLHYILESLADISNKCCHESFLRILSHGFLLNTSVRSTLQSSEWQMVYDVVKMLFDRKLPSENEPMKCLTLLVKWGPLHSFPVDTLRGEFAFITKLCQQISLSSPIPEQEAVLELVHEFCKHGAKDNRMACCKLGEEILTNFIELYGANANDDKMKVKLVEFFLLQVAIHHPSGVRKTHAAAYAVSWKTWTSCLYNIYSILKSEIEGSLERTVRNQSLFVVKNDVKRLFGAFILLFSEVCRQLFDSDIKDEAASSSSEEPPQKRRKRDVDLRVLIENIKETKSWTWVNLTYPFIETYPDMIRSGDYIDLLKTLCTLQVESKEPNLTYHIYKALLVMEKIEHSIDFRAVTEDIQPLWQMVTDSTLRSIGMNQNEEQVQTLLQRLILRKFVNTHESLFQNYKSGGPLSVTNHSLKTLDVTFKHFNYLQFDNSVKVEIMQWILSNNSKCFCDDYLARVLVYLILKQWPDSIDLTVNSRERRFKDIEDTYLTISFEKLVTYTTNPKDDQTDNVFCSDQSLYNTLIDLLTNLVKKTDITVNIDTLMNVTLLIFNVISYLCEYEVIEESAIHDLSLFEMFEFCSRTLFTNLADNLNKNEERSLERISQRVQVLQLLFSTNINSFITRKLREFVPADLIKALFSGLRWEQEEMRRESGFIAFKRVTVQALTSFACLPDSGNLLQVQKQVLEVLLETDYDHTNDDDHEMVLTLLHAVKSCKANSLSEDTFISIFNLIQGMCEARYHCYFSAVKILDLFYEIYPLVSGSCLCQSQFVQILFPFYCKRLDYGPAVSVNLLNCMGLLYELEPNCQYSKWSNEEIVLKISEFLTSDYQEVRFAALQNIAKFFEISTKTRLLEQFHRQEIMFSRIAGASTEILRIEGSVGPERAIDETVTRTCTILHMFASIMVSSYLWIDEALFELLKLVREKNIDSSQVSRVVEMVALNVGFQNGIQFLEHFLLALINRWKSYCIDKFPFRFFQCSTKIEFYAKYWNLLAPVVVKFDRSSIDAIAAAMNKTPREIFEDTCPKLLSYCIGDEVSDLTLLKNNRIYQLLSSLPLQEIFEDKIEEIVLNLLQFVSDEADFRKTFKENVVFRKSDDVCLSVAEFWICVRHIEASVSNNRLVLHLTQKHPDKVYYILLQLTLSIHKCHALEEKLRYFHHLSIVILMLTENEAMYPYLIRTFIHTLLHFIKNHKNQLELSRISCKFFKILLGKLLPDLSNNLKPFYLIVISRLKNLALENCLISDLCVDMLQFLIVEHGRLFVEELEKLDSIPQTSKFEQIHLVHYNIKYSNRKVYLEDEIRQFLDFTKNIESFDECEHSLKHLKTLLSDRKDELKSLYDGLKQTRGFSEDCKDSCLHQLICMLITLSSSTNKNVSTEAVRCLGEIGPGDLTTLILQPEKPLPNPKSTPWELVLGCALALLTKYLIDHDVDVIEASSQALFQILATKEGRKVAESETDYGFGVISCDYLTPFLTNAAKKTNFNINIDGDRFMAIIADNNLWVPENCDHKTWITRLVCAILESFQEGDFFSSFIRVCRLKTEFCEQILPLVTFVILSSNVLAVKTLISTQIEGFFAKHWEITIVNNQETDSIAVNRSSVQCMLNVVHFVRLQRNIKNKKQMKDLDLDYLKVAKAAHFCTAHFTALLYADLWCQEQIDLASDEFGTSTATKLDLIYERVDEITGNALQTILRKAYKAVGEADALLGCGTSYLLNPQCRVEHYKELGKWEQVIFHYEMEVSHGQRNALQPLVQSLNHANFYQLSLFCSDSLEEPNYESLWRLGRWEYNKSAKNIDLSRENYDKYKFYALKALNDNDEFSFKKSVDNVRSCIVQDLFEINLESSKNFYTILTQVQSFNELEDFFEAVRSSKLAELLNKWKIQDAVVQNDFQYIEPVKAQRVVLMIEFLKKNRGDSLRETMVDFILDFAEYARKEGSSYTASRTLSNLRSLPGLSNDVIAKIQFEEAQLCWSLGNVVIAKRILRHLCADENVNPRLHAKALRMTGEWMVESGSENRQTIMDDYFKKSLTLLVKSGEKAGEDEKSMLDTFDQMARFADGEYQQVMTHIKSDIFQKKKENMLKAKQFVEDFNTKYNLKKQPKDLQKALAIKARQSNIDQTEIENIEMDKNNLLKLALKYYLMNLIRSDDHNINIFRLISLLLENRNSDMIKTILEAELIKIPSYKFINILPQIIPHISSATSDLFSQAMNRVIEKCAKEHPYHTLPLILALALSNRDQEYSSSKVGINEARMQSAKNLLQNLKEDQSLDSLITKMEHLSDALIELAYYKSTAGEDATVKLPRKSKIITVQSYDDVLLPTYALPVNKSGDYRNIVGINAFGDSYNNVGGINAPKRITCRGTDGLVRTQLIKGQDDLRQDAVMEQVFTIMNSLLAANKQTKNLLIRTYKIVPLSMRSGILEWVENTMPIGEYLTGKRGDGGAHTKYRPMDRTPDRCRTEFKNAGKLLHEKLRVYNGICKKIKPVFHKFFEDAFPQPTLWYERRRAYIHSVATTSMCGYILGIGDRHVNNILIDKSTAEVVHIDFGIAFEQGRVLPTPETVPFRLTRDIVDGMGVSGVEGVFRKSCEKTVEVLRLHYQTIITILEVLLYDPLYDWTVSSAEANKRQKDEHDDSELPNMSYSGDDDASQDVNVTAERALLRLKAKLQGTEHGKPTTVEHQVGTLIQQAMDPSNLCRLFNGWQPYL